MPYFDTIDTFLTGEPTEMGSRLFRALDHTPNMVTTYSIVCRVAAIWFLIQYQNYLLYALLWMVGYYLDCVDGHLARTYDMVTPWGAAYDNFSDVLLHILLKVFMFARLKSPQKYIYVVLHELLYYVTTTFNACTRLERKDSDLMVRSSDMCLVPVLPFGAGTAQVLSIVLSVVMLHIWAEKKKR